MLLSVIFGYDNYKQGWIIIQSCNQKRRIEMEMHSGNYTMRFQNGGVEVIKDDALLYFNRRPMYAFIKTALSITEFYGAPYENTSESNGRISASGGLKSPTGSELA
jgi:hypothetical protein